MKTYKFYFTRADTTIEQSSIEFDDDYISIDDRGFINNYKCKEGIEWTYPTTSNICYWFKNGKLHRENGPMNDKYFLNGKEYKKSEWNKMLREQKLKRIVNG